MLVVLWAILAHVFGHGDSFHEPLSVRRGRHDRENADLTRFQAFKTRTRMITPPGIYNEQLVTSSETERARTSIVSPQAICLSDKRRDRARTISAIDRVIADVSDRHSRIQIGALHQVGERFSLTKSHKDSIPHSHGMSEKAV